MPEFDYKRYLASREWALLRRAVRDRSGGECERCGPDAPAVAVHHLTYARIGSERLEDLLDVCRDCHAWLSGMSEADPVAEALQWLATEYDSPSYRAELAAWEATTPRPDRYVTWNGPLGPMRAAVPAGDNL